MVVRFPNFRQKSSTSLLLRAVTYFNYVESINFRVGCVFHAPQRRGIDILNRANHGNGNVSCELDLYPILRIPGAPSIILWFSCDLEGTFKTGNAV